MLSVDIKARIGEIKFKGNKSCIFMIETEGKNELKCTITKRNIHLADLVKEGQEIELKGNISAYRKIKNGVEFVDNVLYVNSIAQANRAEIERLTKNKPLEADLRHENTRGNVKPLASKEASQKPYRSV